MPVEVVENSNVLDERQSHSLTHLLSSWKYHECIDIGRANIVKGSGCGRNLYIALRAKLLKTSVKLFRLITCLRMQTSYGIL